MNEAGLTDEEIRKRDAEWKAFKEKLALTNIYCPRCSDTGIIKEDGKWCVCACTGAILYARTKQGNGPLRTAKEYGLEHGFAYGNYVLTKHGSIDWNKTRKKYGYP